MPAELRWVSVVLLLAASAWSAAPSDGPGIQVPGPGPSEKAVAQMLAERLPREHLMHAELDDEVASQALENYLVALDSKHLFFLESDIAGFRERRNMRDDHLGRGDVDFAYDVFRVFKQPTLTFVLSRNRRIGRRAVCSHGL